MRKSIGIIIAGSLSLMLLLGGCDIKFGVDKDSSRNTSSNGTAIDESYEIAKANSIVIKVDISDSLVKTYDGDKIKIVGTIGSESEGINYKLDGDKVTLEEKYSNSHMKQSIGNHDDISQYQILIPESYNGDLSIEYGAGSIDIEDMKVDNFKIKGGAGELIVKNVVFNELNLSSGVGSTNISLTEKCGDITIEGGIGETILQMKEVGGNLKVDGGIGSVDIEVPQNAPVYFKTSSGIGSNDVANVKTSGEKTYLFDLNVGLGEVKVHN